MPQGRVGPQSVGHLLRLEAVDGEHSLPGCTVQQLSAWVVPQRGICPKGVGNVLHSTQGGPQIRAVKGFDQNKIYLERKKERPLQVGMLLM